MRDLTLAETRAVGGGFFALSGADRRWLAFRPARAADAPPMMTGPLVFRSGFVAAEARTLSERAR